MRLDCGAHHGLVSVRSLAVIDFFSSVSYSFICYVFILHFYTVGGGSFNPLTRMHLRTYFLAKQCLEAKYGYVVLGEYASHVFYSSISCVWIILATFCVVRSGHNSFSHGISLISPWFAYFSNNLSNTLCSGSLLSPAHGATVRERYRTNPSEILPSPHRLAVAQLLVQNSKLLSVDPWEITRRRYVSVVCCVDCLFCIVCYVKLQPKYCRCSFQIFFNLLCWKQTCEHSMSLFA